MFDVSGFGNYPIGSSLQTTASINYLTVKPNISYKINNLEFNV